ncbi:hypothetical protein [Pseudoalteromonas sp. NCIMB_1079]|uniref:hypothetical protein n=1 Tax=Pseudoalteromonas sp. NCIMB 1079 TaxID=3142847 RepID=UPI00339BE33E
MLYLSITKIVINVTIAGTSYVGSSNVILLARHNKLIAFDITQEKVDLLNNIVLPIVNNEIEHYL